MRKKMKNPINVGAVCGYPIGVNLGVFVAFVSVSTHAALTGLRRRKRHISINIPSLQD